MILWIIGMLVIGFVATGFFRHFSSDIDGRYDTSIIGTFYPAAFLEFRGTDVVFNDGRNPPTRMGRILRERGDPIWQVPGGTRWVLKKSGGKLVCIDAEDEANRFLLKPVLFAPARIWINRFSRRYFGSED